jgi:drug/metabolite transporter (DMT)-like permease
MHLLKAVMLTGVLLGFGAAFCQSASYLCSRIFTSKYPGGTISLLALSHILMGIFSSFVILFFLPERMPRVSGYGVDVLICVVTYLAGQTFLFIALKTAPASRVSPLLGLKVFMLAIIADIVFKQDFAAMQWTAVVLSMAAAFLLSWTGEKLPFKSMLWILCACFTFCISDLKIKAMVSDFSYMPLVQATVFSACLAYIFAGVLGAGALAFVPRPSREMWYLSAPFAISWFGAMLLLYGCFAIIGVVYGNIVQSTRGIISMLFVPVMVFAGMEHIESKMPRAIFYRRLAAAVLMSGAIALYYLGQKG